MKQTGVEAGRHSWFFFLNSSGANQGQRTRLLLKVLAISDVVIYRTHADRLHDDLFKFLGDASDAYLKHFTRELKATTNRCGLDVPLSTLGPAVIIFHETVHTNLLGSGTSKKLVSSQCFSKISTQTTASFLCLHLYVYPKFRHALRICWAPYPGAFQEAGLISRSIQLHPVPWDSNLQPSHGLQWFAPQPGAAAGQQYDTLATICQCHLQGPAGSCAYI